MSDLVEYAPGDEFPGRVGRTVAESSPAWPVPPRAPEGAPNVLFFVLDDVGYGQLSPFGGLVETPNLDRVAARGLVYTNMHTTALCSPTRSCVLTGRNHHSNGVACIMEGATGFPGYDCRMPPENGFLSEVLRRQGYNTFITGKWHLTPSEESTPAGPFDRWPLGRGFERFYGFLPGETNQWYPDLVQDNQFVSAPRHPQDGYHLDADLADRAIRFILDAHVNAPEKPFFLYHAPGCAHAPHQAPREWIERYRGKFDIGWDRYRETVFARQRERGIVAPDVELPARDPDVPEWDSLSPDVQRLSARFMEVFAGFLSHCDAQFGRILDALEEIGELDNTIVMVLSDNGASAEGGVAGTFNEMTFFNFVEETAEQLLPRIDELGGQRSYNHYPWGWAWAGDTPFRRWKRETYRGGTTDPFLVSWPRGITAHGELRHAYVHAIDMAPTVLDMLGIEPPEEIAGVSQSPVEGTSFAHTFADPAAPAGRDTQYFEMLGNRAIYHDGWRAVCPWPGPSFAEAAQRGAKIGDEITPEALERLDAEGWELYHVVEDPAESRDLAAEHPDRLRDMVALWWQEAERYKVLPLDGRLLQRIAPGARPTISGPRTSYVYYPGGSVVPPFSSPQVLNRPHSIVADLEVPDGGAEGVILAVGGVTGGFSLYVKDGRLRYVHNYLGHVEHRVEASEPLPAGSSAVRFEFEPTGPPDLLNGKGAPGRLQLYHGKRLVASAEAAETTPIAFGLEGLSCGYDFGEAVTADYEPPYAFTGKIARVTVDVSGELIHDDEAELKRLMAQQ